VEKPNYLDSSRTATIVAWPNTHYLDHLAPLAALFDIPLLSPDREILELTKKYYPDVRTLPAPTLSDIAEEYDSLIVTSKMWRAEMGGLIEILTGKEMHFIYCPHGNSDKGHANPSLDPFHCQDSILIYGAQMEEMLANRGIHNGHIIGNYRLHYYLKNFAFYSSITEQFKMDGRTLLYAPTWKDGENLSSFAEFCYPLLEQMPKEWNLLIKLHPFLLDSHFPLVTHLEEKFSVRFLKHFPPVYPVLQACDGYIGDYSSVGYDFLYFNKPMFFFDTPKDIPPRGRVLHKAGLQLPKENIFSFIDKKWDQRGLTKTRYDLYREAFF
jgi:hypothetical protein